MHATRLLFALTLLAVTAPRASAAITRPLPPDRLPPASTVEAGASVQPPTPRTGVITGRVVEAVTEAPVANATVRVVGQEVAGQTDDAGRFVLRGIRPGIITLEIRRLGYLPVTRGDVAVSPAKPAEVLIALRQAEVQLQTVTVRPEAFPVLPAPSTPVSTQTYDAEEVRRQPGAQEDVLRAISVAPGVGVTNAARNDIIVRGGAPFENLFVVDNIEVPNINHFGSQGSTGGPLSLINIRFVENASLSAGGFGARYGDRTSSATTITLREGNRERLAGELNVAASQYGAVLEGPLGSKGSFLANVRQSYLDLLFKAIGASFIPKYTDATVKAVWRPNARNSVSALVIGARGTVSFNYDNDTARISNAQVLAPTQTQYFSGVTWKRLIPRGVVTTTLGRTWTQYESVQNDTLLAPVFGSRSQEGENTLRSDLRWAASPRLTLEAGSILKYASRLWFDATLAGFVRRDDTGAPRPFRIDTTFAAWRNGSYAQASWQAAPRLRLTGGLRGDWYGFAGNALRMSPRLSAALQLDDATTLNVAGGRYWQAPSFIWLVGAPSNATQLRPFRADQVVAGITRLVGTELKVQVEVYGKRYGDYPVRVWRPQAVLSPAGFDDASTDIPFGLEPLRSSGTGIAYGAELFLQKKLGATPFYGQVSASWNRTRFTGLNGVATRGAFDTPILANAVLGWRPTDRWEVATRIRGSSGLPLTPYVTTGPRAGTLDFSRYNGERLATYFAADLRIDRRFLLAGRQFIAFLDLQNITARANELPPQWNPRTRVVERSTGLGLLPSIGLNWEF